MRPSLLDPLFASASALPGVGPKTGKLLDRLLGEAGRPARALDLLLHIPFSSIDRRNRPKIAQAPIGAVSTLKVRVAEHRPPRAKGPWRVLAEDETGDLTLVFFRANSRLDRKGSAGRGNALGVGPGRNFMTPTARWSIPTAFSTRRALPPCRRSSRSMA